MVLVLLFHPRFSFQALFRILKVVIWRFLARSYFQVSFRIQEVGESLPARVLFLAPHGTRIAAKFPLAKALSPASFRTQMAAQHFFALNQTDWIIVVQNLQACWSRVLLNSNAIY